MPVLLSFYGKTTWICRNNLARYLFCFINVAYKTYLLSQIGLLTALRSLSLQIQHQQKEQFHNS